MGLYLLTSNEIECKWQPSDNTKPVPMIKKRLASNQLLISYKEKVQAFDSFQIKVPMNAKILGKQFKATGGKVTLSKNGKSIDTTMGLTQLAGVPMGTRCGDVDQSIIPTVMKLYDIHLIFSSVEPLLYFI